jgi:hypothetical protein
VCSSGLEEMCVEALAKATATQCSTPERGGTEIGSRKKHTAGDDISGYAFLGSSFAKDRWAGDGRSGSEGLVGWFGCHFVQRSRGEMRDSRKNERERRKCDDAVGLCRPKAVVSRRGYLKKRGPFCWVDFLQVGWLATMW